MCLMKTGFKGVKRTGPTFFFFDRALCLCLSGAVRGAEQDFSRSLTAWSVCSDTNLVSSSHSIPLEGLTLTDSGAEGGPCSELSWVGVLIFLFVSPDCGKVKASWNDSLSSVAHSSHLPAVSYIRTNYTVARFHMCRGICCRVFKLVKGRSSSRC